MRQSSASRLLVLSLLLVLGMAGAAWAAARLLPPGVQDAAGSRGTADAGRAADASTASDTSRAADPAPAVSPGIDVLLSDSLHLVQGLRVGLITNQTGVDAEGVASIDRLFEHPEVELVALYSPEHGIRGTAEAGVHVDDSEDAATGLPVHSLYGETRRPTPAMLEGVDALLFDIQDIGARYYTYIYTMAFAMEAAGEADIPFVVLDRPNPIGGRLVQGNVLDAAFSSFVGLHPLPMRHGMTAGELARLYVAEFGVEADLHVVPAVGWRRAELFPATGLPWVAPSPNMPEVESALHYPGTCLFEGTNLSVGRGTPQAFQQIGAPWLDGEGLARALAARELPGVSFEPVRFTPDAPGDGKFDGEELRGVRLRVTDAASYDPTVTGVALLVEARRASGELWGWNAAHFDRLAGTDALRRGLDAGLDVHEITRPWPEQLERFRALRAPVLIYPEQAR